MVAGRPKLIPANTYGFETLAQIYNEARTDYIVPMPMNARRMEEYVRFYDVVLSASFISLNDADEESGIAMLGWRGQRAWITRLGVIPERRGSKVGQTLTEALLDSGRGRGATLCQLEVIEGNEPAHRLFVKLGFEETRRLLVMRRPPSARGATGILNVGIEIEALDASAIAAQLQRRTDAPSWLDETASLLNAGSLQGFRIDHQDGRFAWIVYRLVSTPVTPQLVRQKLSHFVLDSSDPDMTYDLLRALHQRHPQVDTEVENMPADSSHWASFQRVGYVQSFRRIEMLMHL